MSYSEKLKSPLWQKKRLKILERDNFTCCICRDQETELHVHHLKYTKEPWDAPDSDLQTLCKYCHTSSEHFNPDLILITGKLTDTQKEFKSFCYKTHDSSVVYCLIDAKLNVLSSGGFLPNSKTLKYLYDLSNNKYNG